MLGRLVVVFSSAGVAVWGEAAVCCLQVWRDLSLANTELAATVLNLKDIVSSVVLGLQYSQTSPLCSPWCHTILSLLSVLQVKVVLNIVDRSEGEV